MKFQPGQIAIAGSLNRIVTSLDLVKKYRLGHESARFTAEWVFDETLEADIDVYQKLIPEYFAQFGMHGISNQMRDKANLGHPDEELRKHALNRYLQCVDVAAQLGSRHIVFHQWHRPDLIEGWSKEQWLAQAELWPAVGDKAAEHDITIVLENDLTPDPQTMLELLEAVDHPHVQGHIDIAHARLHSEVPIEEWISCISPKLRAVHINNNDGENDNHWPLDKGVIDYAQVLPLLEPLLDQLIMVTIETDPNEREEFKASIRFLDSLGMLPDRDQ